MGWTSYYRRKGETNLEHFQREWSSAEILDAATVGLTFYAACKRRDDPDGHIFAVIVLIHWTRGDYNFTIKEMDESMGPSEASCPPRILDLLSPTDHEYAVEWRARCRRSAERKARAAKVKRGDRVTFPQPIKFADGTERAELIFDRHNVFTADGKHYRITGWRAGDFTVAA